LQTITGIFSSQSDAERALEALCLIGTPQDKLTLLSPGNKIKNVPVDSAEQPGMGRAVGAVVGAVGGLSGGSLLMAAIVPGVGPITVVGLLGAAILAAAGASVGAVAGDSLENVTTEGLPEDEIFLYEDALRRGRSVVIAMTEDGKSAGRVRELLKTEGSEAVDDARQQWWTGLRSAEREHYSASGGDFREDERFYRLGFEAALHARTRCMEFDQASSEMTSKLEELQKRHPNVGVEEPFTRGYRRGREYYQQICNEKKAA
jgi:hypothetical protein